MNSSEREVTLKLNSRPLRLVYLIRNREDLVSAVKLYTHVWGGMSNAILPIPKDELENERFFLAIKNINPDYILTSTERLPDYVSNALKQFPALQIFIDLKKLEEHINNSNLILLRTGTLSTGLHNGRLSHIQSILCQLYPASNNNVLVNLVESSSPYSFELGLLSGFPSQSYQNSLRKLFNVNILPPPKTVEQVIRTSTLISKRLNSVFLSISQVKQVNTESFSWALDNKELHLFLLDEDDIDVACAFWNCRRFSAGNNKLVFKKKDFLENIILYAELLIACMPDFESLRVYVLIEDEAILSSLSEKIQEIFSNIKKGISVKIRAKNLRFMLIQGAVLFENPNTTTKFIASDYSIRFSPSVPPGHKNTEFIFGFDTEVTLALGRKLLMPPTLSSAILLSHRLERIQDAEKHPDSQELKYLKGEIPVRPAIKGITGTTIAGKEARIYISTNEVVINQKIKDAGLIVKPSEHTKYTQGCIKRLGGFQKALTFLDRKCLDILSSLIDQRNDTENLRYGKYTSQKILRWKDITRLLSTNCKWKPENLSNLLSKKMLVLLSTEFVNRGYLLECNTCNFKNWYSISEVKEVVECKGCAEKIQVPLEQQFEYKLNELAYQVIKTGGLAVFMIASILYKIDRSSFIEFGGKLFRLNENENFVEIDLFCLAKNTFIIAECKSINKIKKDKIGEKIDEIKKQLEKNIEAAIALNAQVIVLGIVSEIAELPQLLIPTVKEIAERAAEKQIGVHLILNWKFYFWGCEEVTEIREICLEDLQVAEQNNELDTYSW